MKRNLGTAVLVLATGLALVTPPAPARATGCQAPGASHARVLRVAFLSMAARPCDAGYWVLDSDGGVFTFGDAGYYGSVPALRAAGTPIPAVTTVALAPTPSGRGYWVLDSDGGVFTFGDAPFRGAGPLAYPGGTRIPATDLVASDSGAGYWVLFANGAVAHYGDAVHEGSLGGSMFPSGFRAAYPGEASIDTSSGMAPNLVTADLLDRLNSERRQRGLRPLRWDPLLGAAAQAWSADIAGNGARHGGLGLVPAGAFRASGENVFDLMPHEVNATAAHVGWMRSDPHRRNMLDPGYDIVGVGTVCANGHLYAVQLFGRTWSGDGPDANRSGAGPVDPIVRGEPGGAAC
ncbi:MAG: CAP domain-containing protein [Gemmatimonadales bacterium]